MGRYWPIIVRQQNDEPNSTQRTIGLTFIGLALVLAFLALAFTAVAKATPPTSPPGQGECQHGNSGQECRPDPQPSHGQDCEEHGPNEGGVNEDHCNGTTDDGATDDGTTDDGTTDGSTDGSTDDGSTDGSTDGTIDPTPEPTPEPPVITKAPPKLARTGLDAVSYLWLAALGLSLVGSGLVMRRRA